MTDRDRPSLAAAIRLSLDGFVGSLHAFLAWNAVLAVAAGLTVFLLSLSNLALLAVPLLAPLTCGVGRMAAVAARDEHVALRSAVPGFAHRFWTKVGLAAAQSALLLVAGLNLLVAPAIDGPVAALSLAVSVYLIVTVLAYAIAFWPLLCDPRREEMPVPSLLRLALIVLLRRPLQLLTLLVVAVLSAIVIRSLVVPGLFLPGMVLLMIAGYVTPAADELAPVA